VLQGTLGLALFGKFLQNFKPVSFSKFSVAPKPLNTTLDFERHCQHLENFIMKLWHLSKKHQSSLQFDRRCVIPA